MIKRYTMSRHRFDVRSRGSVFEEMPEVVVRIIFRHDPDDVRSVGCFGSFNERRGNGKNGSEER